MWTIPERAVACCVVTVLIIAEALAYWGRLKAFFSLEGPRPETVRAAAMLRSGYPIILTAFTLGLAGGTFHFEGPMLLELGSGSVLQVIAMCTGRIAP